jgi:hypothetical protein
VKDCTVMWSDTMLSGNVTTSRLLTLDLKAGTAKTQNSIHTLGEPLPEYNVPLSAPQGRNTARFIKQQPESVFCGPPASLFPPLETTFTSP